MTPEELATEKVNVTLELEAIARTNVYGMDAKDRVALTLRQIQAEKRLTEVTAKILHYTSTPEQNPR